MKQSIFLVKENVEVARRIFKMVLEGDTSEVSAPGQFVNVKLADKFLRRPISIADWNENSITLLYKVVGKGTDQMSKLKVGETLDLLTGLGNGFSVVDSESPLLVGGGIGLAPLYALCKRLKNATVVIGSATKEELFYVDEFKALGANVIVSTDDGSEGVKGFVTDAIKANGKEWDYFYCCGPMIMMRNLSGMMDCDGQLSLEERMGCGFGACVGCTLETRNGFKRVCKDGPVFRKEDILW